MDTERLRSASRAELRALIVHGHPVDPASIEGWAYRGTSLGLPRWVEALSWKTFQKTFYREPVTGRLLGWNVRLQQDGIAAPSRPKLRNGEPVTTWHYEVVSPSGVAAPPGFDRGLIIDYGRGNNPGLDTIRITKDPLVAIEAGNNDVLLGVSYLVLGGRCLETPTYFMLEREHPIAHVPAAAVAQRDDGSPPSRRSAGDAPGEGGSKAHSLALLPFERRWAETLFDALLGSGDDAVLPRLDSIDRAAFWNRLAVRTPAYFAPGLRATVYALTFLPVLSRHRRPLFALPPAARVACVEEMAQDPRLTVQQMLSTLKLLACMALFEDEGVRRRLGGEEPTP